MPSSYSRWRSDNILGSIEDQSLLCTMRNEKRNIEQELYSDLGFLKHVAILRDVERGFVGAADIVFLEEVSGC